MTGYIRMYATVAPRFADGELLRIAGQLSKRFPEARFWGFLTRPYWKIRGDCELFTEIEYHNFDEIRKFLGKGEWVENVWNKMNWRKDHSKIQRGQIFLSDKVVWADFSSL